MLFVEIFLELFVLHLRVIDYRKRVDILFLGCHVDVTVPVIFDEFLSLFVLEVCSGVLRKHGLALFLCGFWVKNALVRVFFDPFEVLFLVIEILDVVSDASFVDV